ncbi:MAG: Gfo/Idh/MocA family oxidoreductase [Halolamina sp.]
MESVFWGRDPNAGLLVEFADSLRAGRQPAVSGREALQVVAVIEAAYGSVETGDPATVAQV